MESSREMTSPCPSPDAGRARRRAELGGSWRTVLTRRAFRQPLPTTRTLPLRRSDGGRAGAELDRSSRLELLAVEIEHHDLFLDHALDQERAVVLAPGKPLTPVADLGFGQRHQLVAFDAQHLHQTVVVEERTVLRFVRPI